ncbi:hypothetical protein TNCV_308911 [Trichonephila clavipes]|nr:hypothetical protein TNCV_308911 [Trichonephila clavipes]
MESILNKRYYHQKGHHTSSISAHDHYSELSAIKRRRKTAPQTCRDLAAVYRRSILRQAVFMCLAETDLYGRRPFNCIQQKKPDVMDMKISVVDIRSEGRKIRSEHLPLRKRVLKRSRQNDRHNMLTSTGLHRYHTTTHGWIRVLYSDELKSTRQSDSGRISMAVFDVGTHSDIGMRGITFEFFPNL